MMFTEGDEGASVFDDPEYRERYREKFLEARRRGMDMVVYPDGTIALIENRVVMHTYGWRKRKGEFERAKAFSSVQKKSAYAGAEERTSVEETEYV